MISFFLSLSCFLRLLDRVIVVDQDLGEGSPFVADLSGVVVVFLVKFRVDLGGRHVGMFLLDRLGQPVEVCFQETVEPCRIGGIRTLGQLGLHQLHKLSVALHEKGKNIAAAFLFGVGQLVVGVVAHLVFGLVHKQIAERLVAGIVVSQLVEQGSVIARTLVIDGVLRLVEVSAVFVQRGDKAVDEGLDLGVHLGVHQLVIIFKVVAAVHVHHRQIGDRV